MITNILVVPLTLNYLGAELYGFFITLITLLTWLLLFDFGIGNSVKNFVADGFARNDFHYLSRIYSNSLLLMTIIFFCLTLLIIIVSPFIRWVDFFKVNTLQNNYVSKIVVVSVIVFLFNMILSLGSNIYYGFQKGYIPNLFAIVGSSISLIGVFVAVQLKTTIMILIILYLIGFIISNLISFIYLIFFDKKFLKFSFNLIDKGIIYNILKLGSAFLGVSFIGIIIYSIDNIIITQRLGPEMIARYNPIMRLYQIIIQLNGLFIISLWPAYTAAITQNDWTWIKKRLKSSLKIILIFFFPPTLLLMIFGPYIISFWLNGNIVPPQLLCISIGVWVMIYLFNQTLAAFLNGAGIMGKQIKFGFISIILFLIFGITLTDKYGLIGLSLAGIISTSVGLIANPYIVYKYLKDETLIKSVLT